MVPLLLKEQSGQDYRGFPELLDFMHPIQQMLMWRWFSTSPRSTGFFN